MQALSLWQPWASLIAVGAKRVETRDWPWAYRGLLAIHAAAKWSGDLEGTARAFSAREGVALPDPPPPAPGRRLTRWLPLGAVVAIADLVAVSRMTEQLIEVQSDLEIEAGAWVEGRYAFQLANVRPLKHPYPMKGRQGPWLVDADDQAQILALARAAAGWERDGVVRRDGKGWSSRDNRAETGDEEEPRVRWSKRLRADRGIPAELLTSEKALRLRAKGTAEADQQELFA